MAQEVEFGTGGAGKIRSPERTIYMHISIAVVAAISLLGVASPAFVQATPSPSKVHAKMKKQARQISKLQRQATKLRRTAKAKRVERDAARTALAATQASLSTVTVERNGLRGTVVTLQSQVNGLAAGLPAAVLSAPLEQFKTLVLEPAYSRWPCSSYYEGSSGYWSFNFDTLGDGC